MSKRNIVLIPLLLLSLLFSAVGCGGQEEATTTSTVTPTQTLTPAPTVTPTQEYLTYTDEVSGFSISYPSDWMKLPLGLMKEILGEDSLICYCAPINQPDEYMPVFHIVIEELPFSVDVESYWTLAKRYLTSMENYKPISTESTTISDLPAIVHVFTFTEPADGDVTVESKWVKAILVEDSMAWIITCESTVPYFTSWEPIFNNIIDSFYLERTITSPIPTTTTSTPTPSHAIEYLTYTDEVSGFSISKPSDWDKMSQELTEGFFGEGCFVSFLSSTVCEMFSANYVICSEELISTIDLESYFDMGVFMIQRLEGYTSISQEKLTINGRELIKHVYTWSEAGVTYQQMYVFLVDDMTGWNLILTSIPICWDQHEAVFDTVVDSFRLLK